MAATNPEENRPKNPTLNAPDHPIIALYRLMRQLPDDITNAGELTHDQAQKALAAASYAQDMQRTLVIGLAEIGKLMHKASSKCGDSMSPFSRLIQHLAVEAEFMQNTAFDYRDAVKEYCR